MTSDRVVSPVLVGRDEALARLGEAFRDAVERGPGVALVAGEAGIGKSRLIGAFADGLPRGARVVEGACAELGGEGLPYAPFVAVVRRLLRELGAERVAALLPGPRRELARWFPEIGPDAPPAADGTGRHRLYEEILTLVERAAARPLVLAVEDLHWADAATRELFAFLARNLTAPGVLLLASHRPDGAGALAPLLSELARGPRTTALRLERLSRDEVGRQLAAILGSRPDPVAVRRVHERSDGNPLFVEALAQAGERTPDSLRGLLLYGPRSASGAAREVLRAAAVAGGRVPHGLLETVTGRAGAALDTLLRELVDRSLLLPAEDGYAFRHALIRQAVYEDLLPGERVRLHARYAAALRDADTPADLAAHAYAAGDHEQALDAAWRAACTARASYAYEEQVRMLDRVLDLWDRMPDPAARLGADRGRVLSLATEGCMLSGDYARGVDYATAGLAETDAEREPLRAAWLLEHRGRLLNRSYDTGMDDFARALELHPGGPDSLDRGRLLGLMAMGCLRGRIDTARPLAEEALRIGRRTGDPTVTVRGLLSVGLITADAGMLTEAAALTERTGNDDLLLTAPMYLAMHHTDAGDQRRSVEAARTGLRRARRVGLARSRGALLAGHAAQSLTLSGRYDEAAALLREAREADPPPHDREQLSVLDGLLALCRGDLPAARAAAGAVARADPRLTVRLFARHRLDALLALAEGEPEKADAVIGAALSDPVLAETYSTEARPVLVAGALVQRARTGRGVAARRARLAEADAALPVRGRLDAALHTMLAALLTDDTPAGWDRAVSAWRELDQPYELAQSLACGARAARAAGDAAGAAARDAEAAALAGELGAVLYPGEPAHAEPPPRDTGGLTPRERDVLDLLAAGLSNREIARRLSISQSTAGVHVSHILAKLGAATRTEAAAIAHRTRLVRP